MLGTVVTALGTFTLGTFAAGGLLGAEEVLSGENSDGGLALAALALLVELLLPLALIGPPGGGLLGGLWW